MANSLDESEDAGRRAPPSPWHSRILVGDTVGLAEPPAWLRSSYARFRVDVIDATFPCFFGTQAERRGEMFYAFSATDDWRTLAASVATFCALATNGEHPRSNLAVFFEPHATPLGMTDYRAFCWQVLQHLHDADQAARRDAIQSVPADPEDPAWEFSVFGTEMFVVGCSPAYAQRRSRNLGPGIVMLFQPRHVFVDQVTKRAISQDARAEVRRRLIVWDGIPAHPDLGVYGDPNNREWKQYFLADENRAEAGTCPLRAYRRELAAAPTTIAGRLRAQAASVPSQLAVRFLPDPGGPLELTYGELDRAARRLAAQLLAVAEPGDRALLLLPTGLEYVVAFFACLYAGIIAVPAYSMAEAEHNPQHRARLAGMARDARPRLVLVAAHEAAPAGLLDPAPVCVTVSVDAAESAWQPAELAPEAIAFLQYTSGSTRAPRGVAVSHGNLIANERAIARAFAFDDRDVVVSWLPLYHDMGLIGGLLAPIFNGVPLVLLSPRILLQSPLRWLRVIAEHGGTISGGPDAAFQLVLQRAANDELDGLDLSRWRVAFSGAEPIRAHTMRGFAERFARHGFAATALTPCYGLAEATLMVASARAGEGARAVLFDAAALARGHAIVASDGLKAIELVDCGGAIDGCVRVSDPVTGVELDDSAVGELWVSNPSVAAGYFGNADETERVFRWITLEDGSVQRFLRTGDLGFVRAGRVFVSGRAKDLIILRGQNFHPADIESALELRVAGLRSGRVAAFAVQMADGEGIAIAVEVALSPRDRADPAGRPAALIDELRRALADECQVPAALVLLLRPGALPRTSSGKIQRSACLAAWQAGELRPIATYPSGPDAPPPSGRRAPSDDPERAVAALWGEVLGPRDRGVDDDFFAEGGDSLTLGRLQSRLRARLGAELSLAQLFGLRTIASQARALGALGAQVARTLRPGANEDQPAPLTAAQRGLWFLQRLAPDSAAYTVRASLCLRGALEAERLRGALLRVIERHALLRARFVESSTGEVHWRPVAAAAACRWFETTSTTPAEVAERLGHEPFDLTQGPLVRAALVRSTDDEHHLVLAFPHLIIDGESVVLLLRELAAGYAAPASDGRGTAAEGQRGSVDGRGTPAGSAAEGQRGSIDGLAPLAVQFADYAHWEAAGEPARAATDLAWWRDHLGGELRPLVAPGRRAEAEVDAKHADDVARLELELPPAVVAAARVLALDSGATLAIVLLAAFDATLRRYTDESTFAIGIPTTARPFVELEPLIGHFVELVVHQVTVSGATSFRALIRQVRDRLLAAQAHRGVALPRIAAALGGDRGGDVQVTFNHHALAGDAVRFGDLIASEARVGNVGAPFDWTLDVRETPARVVLTLEVRAQRFAPALLQQVLADYAALVAQVTRAPDRALAQVTLAYTHETARVRPFVSIVERIAARAAQQPDAPAITCDGETLSYGALATGARALAGRLIARGVTREVRVALCVRRSPALAIGVLGILAAGGVVVPLDATYPHARLAAMLDDAGVQVVVVDGTALPFDDDGIDGLGALLDSRTVVQIGADPGAATAWPPALPAQLAYVLFTSGSSGRAKGVAVSHRALALHVDDYLDAFAVSAADRVLQFSTFGFDAALEQLLPILTVGGCVVMRGPAVWSWDELDDVLARERVTLAYLPTGYFEAWTRARPALGAVLPALRLVTCGGEALTGDAVRRWRSGPWRHVPLDNTYGPTEATVTTSAHRVTDGDARCAVVPIGTSLPAREARVLDRDGADVPPGGIGELCLGGASLARGYLGRPGATAERFVPDAGGGRLYRTGDRCRRRADGALEYLGRLDHQVKLRGHRIELGDVEAALRSCPGVEDAVALIRGDGEQRALVAWVTGGGTPAGSAAGWPRGSIDGRGTPSGSAAGWPRGSIDPLGCQRALRDRLPPYMVPSAIVPVAALPRLPNGKLDRAALPAPRSGDDHARATAAATTPRERVLVEIWQQVLGRADLGIHDDFFALGGDSITSLHVVARARAAGLQITPRAVFERPTVAELALAAVALAPEPLAPPSAASGDLDVRGAVLARLGLAEADVEDVYPATPVQAGLLFHAELADPGDAVYIDQVCLTLRGPLDPRALDRAWQAAAARHPALRTAFAWFDGRPLQVVLRAAVVPFTEHDARAASDYPALRDQLQRQEVDGGFALDRAPLMRVLLVQRPDGGHDLIWTNHHVLLDGWSVAQLASEVLADQAAIARGGAAAVASGPRFADYVRWLQRQPTGEDFWRAELASWRDPAGQLALLPRPPAPASGSHHLRRTLAPQLAAELRASAARARVTLSTIAQAAWALVLARFGHRAEAVFGLTVSGRPTELPDAERMIGLFIHTLPMRVALAPQQDVASWLRAVQRHAAEVRVHETTPLSELQRWAGQPGAPLFDTALVFESYPVPEALRALGGARTPDAVVIDDVTTIDRTHYPLTLTVHPEPLRLEWEWDRARLGDATVEALATSYEQVLEQLARPTEDLRVGQLAIAAAPVAAAAAHAYRSVVQRLEAACARRGAAPALRCEGVVTSYAALDDRATEIAEALRAAGVGGETLVGVSVGRSAALVAALFGVWKAGGAWVPLDPTYPPDRLRQMLRGVSVVLCDATSEPSLDGVRRIRIDQIDRVAAAARAITGSPGSSLAYVIYTSGSTGEPKGVAVSHAALSAHLDDFIATYQLGEADRTLFSSTASFDVAIHELFPALTVGGQVVMRGDEPWSLDTLSDRLRDDAVTVARIGTAYFRAWSRRVHAPLPALRQLTTGGEGLDGDVVRDWFAGALAAVPLDNLYGPTETTVAATRHRVAPADRDERVVPIGAALPSRTAYVVDRDGNTVPVGATGELCLGGVTVARGYLGRAGLTAERFVPDPHDRGARLYRTGDVCRDRADGVIEFLGRADRQVKLRGYRIELGDIEAALRACDGIHDAVVIARGDGEARRLIAYAAGTARSADALEQVARHLPAYMVPAACVMLPELPRLPNGKLDARALPEPEAASTVALAPRTPVEAALHRIWREVLKRDDLGVRDNFYELGGDSIASLQIVARAREAGLALSPKQLLERPTIEGAAQLVQPVEAAPPAELVGDVPLTPIQARFFARHPDGTAHWNQYVVLRVAQLERAPLERALTFLVQRHDALRLRFARGEDGWTARVVDGTALPFGSAAGRGSPAIDAASVEPVSVEWIEGPDAVAAIAREGDRIQRSLDLAAGPLLRAAHVRSPDGEARLLLVVHHLAVDGVSWRILLDELETTYARAERGEPLALPRVGMPWSAWATSLVAHARGRDFARALERWQRMLRGGVSGLAALGDGDASYGSSRELAWRLPASTTARLVAMAPRAYRMRVDEVLLAALAEVLCAEAGGRVLFDLEGHGREDIFGPVDLGRTVGWFTTRFPVALAAAGGPRDTLIAVKEQLRAVPDRGVPWGLLCDLDDAPLAAAARALPRPEISFNYLGNFDGVVRGATRFHLTDDPAGDAVDPASQLAHALDINARIQDGVLRAGFRFSPARLDEARVRRLIDGFERALAALVAHGEGVAPGSAPTASDFPLAEISQDDLEHSGLELANLADLYPATPLQAGLLFHSAGDRDAGQYVYQLHLRLEGALDVDAFRAAWQAALERHELLRTSFTWLSARIAGPLQAVQRHAALPWTVHELAGDRADDFAAALEATRRAGFDPERAPLFRLELFRRDAGRWDFVWTLHHALADGWSSARLLDEVVAAYAARVTSSSLAGLPPAPRFADYVAWRTRQPSAEAYFRDQLAAIDAPSDVLDGLPPGLRDNAGERLWSRDAAYAARLHGAAQRHHVTVATLVQAAWALVLARRGDRAQAVFGVTVAGRPAELPGVERMVGPFLNTLPLWLDVGGADERAVPWLGRVHRASAELHRHAHAALGDVQRWAGQPGSSLFDSLIVVENYPFDREALAGLAARAGLTLRDHSVVSRTHYAVSLTVTAGSSFELVAEWDGHRIGGAAAAALVDDFLATLEALAGLAADDRRSLRALCAADAARPTPIASPFRSVVARIAEQAARRPAAIALQCGRETLSYADLLAEADRIASRLGATTADERIGVAVERSLAMVSAIVGIWRAGAAYVPFDPSYPDDRLQAMARAAGVTRIVADRAGAARLATALPDCDCLVIDGRGVPPAVSAAEGRCGAIDGRGVPPAPSAVSAAIHPEQLAYVIFTSGSTGEPKGVALSHRALAVHVDDYVESYALDDRDRVYQFSTISFDAAAEQLFPALATGARVIVRGPEIPAWAGFTDELDAGGVTVVDLPTAFFHGWIGEAPRALPALRLVTVGGEALPPDAVAAFHAGALGAIRLDNSYGPTEAAIAALAHRTTAADAAAASVPLGRPYPRRTAAVLDRFGDASAPGALGELCLGGDSLARGYLGRPGATAERFVPDPAAPGGRLYRTGDVCRRLADGTVLFVGRRDAQIKLRGHRVELGDLEAALRAGPGVRSAAAIVRAGGDGPELCAYVTGDVDPVALEADVRRRLPAYLVPRAIVVLAALPIGPSGKLDRRALPAPERAAARPAQAPRNEVEAQLLAVFREVLGRDDLGVDDDFLALGGDSIASLRVASRANARGLAVTPRQVLEYPTVTALAAVAGASRDEALLELWAPLPVTPIQAAFFAQHPGGEDHYNQAILVRVRTALDAAALQAAVSALVDRHDALRLRFSADGASQRVAPPLPLQVQVHDLDGADWRAQLAEHGERLQRSLSIAAGPLFAAAYFRVAGGEGRLLLIAHHLTVDGVSWRILLDELAQGYAQAAAGRAVALPPRGLPWSAWVAAQAAHAASAQVRAELPRWQRALADAPREVVPATAGTCPRPAAPPHGGAVPATAVGDSVVLRHAFPAAFTVRLFAEAPRAYRLRIDELLLAALAHALAPGGGLFVDVEHHGRDSFAAAVDPSRTVGWFTTIAPLWLPALPADPVATVLQIKDALRRLPDGGAGFGLLAYAADEDARAAIAALPRPQILFNYLGRFAPPEHGLFTAADEPCGTLVAPTSPLGHALEVNALTVEDALTVSFRCDPRRWSPAAHAALVARFAEALGALVEAIAGAGPQLDAADVPLAGLTPGELARLPFDTAGVVDLYPATPLQQGLLFHTLYAREAAAGAGRGDAYVNQLCVELRGALDPARLEGAWRAAVARHAILRTRFEWAHGGDALQVVYAEVALPFEQRAVIDRAAAEAEANAELARGIDLARAPLFRLRLLRIAADHHVLVFTSHHALLDGWSNARLLAEVRAGYAHPGAAITAAPAFHEHVAWLRRRPDAAPFWRARLAAAGDAVGLFSALAAPDSHDDDDGEPRLELALPPGLTARLRARAQRERVTLSTLVHATWALVVARHTDRLRVVFGTTVSGRPPELVDVEAMLGLFINSVPVWADVPADAAIGSWLRALQDHLLALGPHVHVPLHELQRWAGRPATPLFDTLVVFENFPSEDAPPTVEGVEFAVTGGVDRTHYPLTLTVADDAELAIGFSWQPTALDRDAVTRLSTHVVVVLAQLADPASARVGDLRLAVPGAAGRTAAPPAYRFVPVVDRVRAHAARTPDAIAVRAVDGALSYGRLRALVDQLAARVRRALPAGAAEPRVGLCVDRALALPLGMLGALAAGAAYVPLDPDYPADRLRFMLDDAALDVVLADAASAARHAGLFEGRRVVRISLDDDAGAAAAASVHPEQLAYVLYTSGSTGRPKGVAVRHEALDRFLQSFVEQTAFGRADGRVSPAVDGSMRAVCPRIQREAVWVSVTSASFDISALELLGPLVAGARVVIASAAQVRDGVQLAALLAETGATMMQATPTVWRGLLDGGLDHRLSLTALSGGEPLPGDLAAALVERGATLWNLYGPTETTIWSSAAPIAAGDPITLGAALPATTLRVLDQRGEPVPVGAIGELCIGGGNLARGYLGRAGLTAERFCPDPFDAGQRLYRTGDSCRLRPDGRLDFLGRRDDQIKLRGHRIELGEIEAALRALPGVTGAAVAIRGEAAQRRLIGYVTGDADLVATRAALAARLPAIMVPAVLVPLAQLPTTLNGKLARGALPEVASDGGGLVPLETPTEHALAALWGELLGYAPVGRDDDFLAAGGHSLLAVRLAARVRHALGRELALGAILATPTLRALAEAIDRATPVRGSLPLAPRTPEAPLTHAQERLWFLWKLDPSSTDYAISGALALTGALDRAALQAAVDDLVARHEVLRTRFAEHGGVPVQIVAVPAPLDIVRCDARGDDDDALSDRLIATASRPFDLAGGPLLRVELYERAPERHVLFVALHHIVGDGASVERFLDELAARYNAHARGAAAPVVPLARQYRDVAAWERTGEGVAAHAAQLDYWREALAGELVPLELPADRSRRGPRDGRGGRLTRRLSAAALAAVDAAAGAAGATRFAFLLAALDALLHRYAGATDVRVGLPVSVRRHVETEPLIGLFVNTLVHRVELSPRLAFAELLRRVRTRLVGDLAHGDVSFARVIEAVAPERSTTETPLFNVSFNFEDGGGLPALVGLDVQPWSRSAAAVPFDLMIDATARPSGAADGLDLAWSFARDRFDEATVARIAEDYLALVAAAAADPTQRLGELASPSTAGEPRPAALPDGSAVPSTAAAAPAVHAFTPVLAQFRAQAQQRPEAVAVVAAGARVSYRELDAWARRIGQRLRAHGVAREDRVAICVDRSAALAAAILGVLDAGAAYLPLDPRHPADRLRATLDDAGARVVLVDDPSVAVADGRTLISVADGDEPWGDAPAATPHADELAYVIYTSGSTGRPKGVGVSHGNVARLFAAADAMPIGDGRRFASGPDDVWSVFHSAAFDFSVWELFGPLISGGRAVIVPHDVARDAERFHALLAAERVTILSQTPSAFAPLMRVDGAAFAPLTALRAIVFGGEKLEPGQLGPWAAARGVALPAIINMYGITETTVHVTHRALAIADLVDGTALPFGSAAGRGAPAVDGAVSRIGQPLDDLTLHVLDRDLHPVPLCGIGELYVGGAGVARGYLGRPGLTAERFVPDPFGPPGARLYASGDRARRLLDGDLAYLGRSDFQVKVRGHRIELGEIEATLRRHPAVRDAAVLARAHAGELRIAAFVVAPALPAGEAIAGLRGYLAARLPAPMLPAELQLVSALPLNSNGKLDRAALLALPTTDEAPSAAAATPTEALVVRVFGDALGVAAVGVDADFFELGGHSLMAVRVTAALGAALGARVSVASLFEHPTPRALARQLDATATPAVDVDALAAMSDLLDDLSTSED